MRRMLTFWKRPAAAAALWIAVCFSLASGVWLTSEYHLLTLLEARTADLLIMVAGYLLQAAGTALAIALLRRSGPKKRRGLITACAAGFLPLALPAMLSHVPAVAVGFGLAMNMGCGIIGGFYLHAAALRVEEGRRGLVFGCGYAASTVFVWLLSLPGEGSFLGSRAVLIVYALLVIPAALLPRRLFPQAAEKEAAAPAKAEIPGKMWVAALLTVFLLSLVKGMGFSFPSADIEGGLSVELSRVFYAVGLTAAGFITDRNRKWGAVCTAAALAIPFASLAMTGEAVPSLILWGLDYLFFGFFSVFRAVLTMDMAARSRQWHLAPAGLMAGRAGDALGSALCMALTGHRLALVLLTLGLFAGTMVLFFHLFQRLYMPEAVREKSEQEVFAGFAIQHDLSAREKEVLRLVLAGQSNTQIADALFVSESTVKFHVHNLLHKTGCRTRQELVRKYHLALYPGLAEPAQGLTRRADAL